MKIKYARWAEICIITCLDNGHGVLVLTVTVSVDCAMDAAKQNRRSRSTKHRAKDIHKISHKSEKLIIN